MTDQRIVEIDRLVAPISIFANQLRQVWDTLDPRVQAFVPVQIKGPMLALFGAVEAFDRSVGLARESGLIPPKATAPNPPSS